MKEDEFFFEQVLQGDDSSIESGVFGCGDNVYDLRQHHRHDQSVYEVIYGESSTLCRIRCYSITFRISPSIS